MHLSFIFLTLFQRLVLISMVVEDDCSVFYSPRSIFQVETTSDLSTLCACDILCNSSGPGQILLNLSQTNPHVPVLAVLPYLETRMQYAGAFLISPSLSHLVVLLSREVSPWTEVPVKP